MKAEVAAILGVAVALVLGATQLLAAPVSAKQASLDEHQTACLEAGGTLTSWHFVINQVSPATNAPASITVSWENGDSEVVPLDRVTGKVAHYTVEGTASHTLIESATADIYAGWTGQFNLSSVKCTPPLDACAEFDDRIVIQFNALLGNPASGLNEESASVPVDIDPGVYMVTLQSFDLHSVHGGQGQQNEQRYARFTAGATVDTGIIDDLADDLDVLNQQVGTVEFTSAATEVVARHELAGGVFTATESITAVCVALDPVR
jgi:hypothetical protein